RSQPDDGADSNRLRAILAATQARQRDGMQRALWHRHRSRDCVRVHGHVVIIAGTRAEVTPRHNFVIRVVRGAPRPKPVSCNRGTAAIQVASDRLPGGAGPARYDPSGQAWRPQTAAVTP